MNSKSYSISVASITGPISLGLMKNSTHNRDIDEGLLAGDPDTAKLTKKLGKLLVNKYAGKKIPPVRDQLKSLEKY